MSNSSDSSDDENAALLREAVDTTFFTDDMYKENDNKDKKVKAVQKKSQRYLATEEQHADVRVSSDMQARIGNRVSEIIGKQIKFVNVEPIETTNNAVEGGIRLFSDSTSFVSDTLPEEVKLSKKDRKMVRKRTLAEELGGKSADVLESVVVSSEHILSGVETQYWSSRQKPKVFKYKSKKGQNILEAVNSAG